MRVISQFAALLACAAGLASPGTAQAWGPRAHAAIDKAALAGLPDDGPVFLREHAEQIGAMAILPDFWRSPSEPFAKIDEDPNHGWFKEQFAFLSPVPRSRHEFLIALLDRQRSAGDPSSDEALRTNVRWTGTLPYAAMEAYGRLVAGMRYRRRITEQGGDTRFIDQGLVHEVIRLGHYIGDGAQPLHTSIHSDGWRGDNPEGYTRDRSIHGRFESRFIDLIGLSDRDLVQRMPAAARQRGDLFDAVLAFLDESFASVEAVYRLDQRGAFADPENQEARDLAYRRATAGAAMLRDMLQRAWTESAQPAQRGGSDPLASSNPAYNPETGSAPPR